MRLRTELLIVLLIATVGGFVAYMAADHFLFPSGQPALSKPL